MTEMHSYLLLHYYLDKKERQIEKQREYQLDKKEKPMKRLLVNKKEMKEMKTHLQTV